MAATSSLQSSNEPVSEGTKASPRKRKNKMATSQTVPTETVDLVPPQRTLLNLDTFEDVTLIKKVPPFVPVTTAAEAMARINNDQAKFIELMNKALQSEAKQAAIDDSANPWLEVDDDGTETPFTGTAANKTV